MTTIVDCGGNCASVARAFERLGVATLLTDSAVALAAARRIVVPGVGHFGAFLAALDARGLRPALLDAARLGTPLLGICLGMQALFEGSEEAPGVPGLGLLPGSARRLAAAPPWRVPHVGWSRVPALGDDFYFTHSYAVPPGPHTAATAWCGAEIAALARRDNVAGAQFHPEKSGDAGLRFLAQWLRPAASRPNARIIACLDVAGGRVVKGVQFVNLRDCGDPAELAAAHARSGADEIFLLDIAATPEGAPAAPGARLPTVRRVARELAIPLGVGGGVRSVADAAALIRAGADKISVNSAAVARPALIAELAAALGSQAVVVAVDARGATGQERVMVRGGRDDAGRDAVAWCRQAAALGAGEILLTSMDRDGGQAGFDCELTARVAAAVPIPVIASGGAGAAGDFVQVLTRGGASAALAASVFHDGRMTAAELKRELAAAGIAVRP